MTAVTPATQQAAPTAAPAGRRGRFGNLLLSEWTKIRSVRSTVWTLSVFVVISVGLTALLSWLIVRNLTIGRHGAAAQGLLTDPLQTILGAGVGLGQLAICVLGVLVITSEYSSGTIRASVLAVPRRIPVMVAKGVVFAVLVYVLSEIVVFGAFFVGSVIVHSRDLTGTSPVLNHLLAHDRYVQNGRITVLLSQPNVLRVLIGGALYLTVLGLFALAIGSLIRHTAGAIATVIGLLLVIFPLTGLLPSSWGAHIHAYMPTIAGQLITNDQNQSGQLLPAWGGLGVFAAWTALLLIAGTILLKRRDA